MNSKGVGSACLLMVACGANSHHETDRRAPHGELAPADAGAEPEEGGDDLAGPEVDASLLPCDLLSIEQCDHSPDCHVLKMRPWNAAEGCWARSVPAACVPADGVCPTVEGCLTDPDGKVWRTGGCAPANWSAGVEACISQPDCEG